MKDFCPACNIITEYEVDLDGEYCSLCGRTKKIAESVVASEKSKKFKNKIRNTIYFSIFSVVILSMISMYIFAPDRLEDVILNGFIKANIFIIMGVIFYGFYRLLKKLKILS